MHVRICGMVLSVWSIMGVDTFTAWLLCMCRFFCLTSRVTPGLPRRGAGCDRLFDQPFIKCVTALINFSINMATIEVPASKIAIGSTTSPFRLEESPKNSQYMTTMHVDMRVAAESNAIKSQLCFFTAEIIAAGQIRAHAIPISIRNPSDVESHRTALKVM
jgi:hypothetical protein